MNWNRGLKRITWVLSIVGTVARATLFVLLPLAVAGCTYSTPGGSGSALRTGISSHVAVVKGDTNMPRGYKDYPVYGGDEKTLVVFSIETSRYLEGVKDDLEEIRFRAKDASGKLEDASRKLDAVADAAATGGELHCFSYIGSRLFIKKPSSNFVVHEYPEFPAFNYMCPQTPITNDRFTMNMYRQELANFQATIEAYLEDGRHFVENCENDYNKVRMIGKECVHYTQSLRASGVEVAVSPFVNEILEY